MFNVAKFCFDLTFRVGMSKMSTEDAMIAKCPLEDLLILLRIFGIQRLQFSSDFSLPAHCCHGLQHVDLWPTLTAVHQHQECIEDPNDQCSS